jgi:hypothetical protein
MTTSTRGSPPFETVAFVDGNQADVNSAAVVASTERRESSRRYSSQSPFARGVALEGHAGTIGNDCALSAGLFG